ncbi:beta-ketoacyl synthase N-terminal-like domain-containing protein [Micromonospora sp. NPDC051296]|uniref:beta-ketoacyl synthase N-terminal-like domain-containing protein n=1 Tax=Micromonospora sp. NPDC051296 TaxID=3155046 RepID=UPI003447C81F
MTRPLTATERVPGAEQRVTVRVTGWSLHLPDADKLTVDLAGWSGVAPQRLAGALAGAVPADRAHEVLGRKGLLFKEPATRLALCAVHRALGLPPGRNAPAAVDPTTAVVVAGNLGNVATVADLARTVRADGGRAVSPLAAPNASSNVVASTIALWFGFGGANLMICSGATAGLDAVRAAALLLRAGRAARVVVVGAEPADEVATGLHQAGRPPSTLRAGAACLVLTTDAGTAGGAGPLLLPAGARPGYRRLGPGGFDPAMRWGDCYGAAGVVNLALAATLLDAGVPGPLAVACGDDTDGRREAMLDTDGQRQASRDGGSEAMADTNNGRDGGRAAGRDGERWAER